MASSAAAGSAGPVVVIGSVNMDLVCRTPRMPAPGETVMGDSLVTIPGGKGANQAVAAAKLGGEVFLVGRVGDDDFGQRLLNGLTQHGVKTGRITVTEGTPSGCAMILVDAAGENSIVVAPGANAKLTPEDVDAAQDVIARAAAVVLQLEVPPATVRHAIAVCQRLGVFTILDPAPAPPDGLPGAMFGVDILTPNQNEAERLAGLDVTHGVTTQRIADPKQVAMELLSRGAKSVVMKLGGKGAMLVGRDGRMESVAPFRVSVTDTTAAGDAFTGALAVAVAEGKPLAEAVRFANAAGALCCQGFGAQPSLPSREAVEALIGQR